MCELRLCERERDRNFYFRFSPEVKTETEPKLRFGKFFSTDGVGLVRFSGVRYGFGEP